METTPTGLHVVPLLSLAQALYQDEPISPALFGATPCVVGLFGAPNPELRMEMDK